MKYTSLFFICLIVLFGSCTQRIPQKSPLHPEEIAKVELPSSPPPRPVQQEPVAMVDLGIKKLKKEQSVIIIDPGHGGEDFGTHSLGTPKYQEKYLNLSTAQLVRGYLQQFGYKVIMTRNDDTFIPLDQRASFANDIKPKLFVSVHFNSAPSREAEGIEVFYFRNEDDKTRSTQSKQLAQAILDKTLKNTNAKSRGVKHGNYAVLRQTNMPAVLIEGGFLTSEAEMEKIKDANYLKSLALGIAQGIQEYIAKESIKN